MEKLEEVKRSVENSLKGIIEGCPQPSIIIKRIKNQFDIDLDIVKVNILSPYYDQSKGYNIDDYKYDVWVVSVQYGDEYFTIVRDLQSEVKHFDDDDALFF